MSDFAHRHPVRSSFWSEVEDISLLNAALLTLGIEPSALGEEREAMGEPVPLEDLPENFLTRIEVLRSAIRAGTLTPITQSHDEYQRIDENKTRIKTADFVDWCDAKGLSHNIPDYRASAKPRVWPWGDYETKLLRELAAAADNFWNMYDPDDAPTNKEVAAWLMERGAADRTAEVMATILRADGLRPGPRKKSPAPDDL